MRCNPRLSPASVVLVCALALGSAAPGQAPPAALSPGQAALAQGDHVTALRLLEGELKADPGNQALIEARVDALMDLHKYWEAGEAAASGRATSPALKLKTGLCLMAVGRMPEAAQVLSPLRADPEWGGAAYVALVRVLLAVGQEKDALDILREGLGKSQPPPKDLLRLSLDLESSCAPALKSLDALEAEDSTEAKGFEAWRNLCSAAGANLSETSLSASLPFDVNLGDTPVPSNPAGSVSSSPRIPKKPAPSARAYGSGTYSYLPPSIKFYAEGEATNSTYELMRIVVPVSIEGAGETLMALDSGSPELMVSPDLAKKLNLKTLGTKKVWTLGLSEPEELDLVLLQSLRVGPVQFANVPAVVVREKLGVWGNLGGVLPTRLLRSWALHYDRRKGKLGLYPSGTRPDAVLGRGCQRVKILWSDGLPFVQVGLQDLRGGYMLLDTTSDFTYLDASRLSELKLGLFTTKYGVQSDRVHAGIINSGVTEDVRLTIGASVIRLPSVRAADLSPAVPLDCRGVLGRDILDLFDLFLDYGTGTLAIKGYGKGK